MGGSNAPFLYDRPQSWTFGAPTQQGFNPRAATQASWAQKPQRPKSNGPLVDFNQHPDSYLHVPYGNLSAEPMPPNTKSKVVRVRTCLLVLRWAALLAALGMLFCVIAINKTSTAVAWIIRVAPALAVAHCFYAVYHLSRSVTARTPGSTASYMIFSGLIDLGLLPFCGFSAYMSYLDYAQNAYEWGTLFNNNDISYKIIFAFFILSSALGGILAISLALTIWLAQMFRKITKLPPDMNPLEENLTSRFGHKRNKSSMNITEKHMSASTLAAKRQSDMSGRRVPFIHTRTDSADSVTLYGNDSARNSRVEMRKGFEEVTKDPYRVSINSLPGSPLRPNATQSPAPNSRPAGAGLDYRPGRVAVLNSSPQHSPERAPEKASSWLSYMDYEGQPTELSEAAEQQLNHEVRPISPVSAISSNGHGPITHTWSNRPSVDLDHSTTVVRRDVIADSIHDATMMAPPHQSPNKRSREPLAMNPPSPIRTNFDMNDENYYGSKIDTPYYNRDPQSSPARPALTSTDGNSRASSFIGSGTKGRFYGDLRASIGSMGVEKGQTVPQAPQSADVFDDHDHDRLGVDRSHTTKSSQSASDYSANFEVYGSDDDEEEVPTLPPQYIYQQQSPYGSRASLQAPTNNEHYSPTPPPIQQSPARKPVPTRKYESPRQTSNSTALDLHSGYAGLDPEFGRGMARRRDVSGKIAEEGRGGVYSWDGKAAEQVNINVEELTPKKAAAYKSAGWARFKGL
jgi:hypothetical protein